MNVSSHQRSDDHPPDDRMRERLRQLEAKLEEKDSALRELQHRAKNSLQLVLSLLRLQSGRIRDPDSRAAFERTLQRVEALVIIFRQLHEGHRQTRVDLGRYLGDLASAATADGLAGRAGVRIDVQIDAEAVECSLSTALSLGLIVNELLLNSLRHGYPDEAWVRLTLRRTGPDRAEIVIADNGRGLPSGFDSDADAGMMLAEALAAQIGGAIAIDSSHGGTIMTVTFPL